MVITSISQVYPPNTDTKEILALIANPSLISNDRKYYLHQSKAGNWKLTVHYKRKKCYFSKHYHVTITGEHMSI